MTHDPRHAGSESTAAGRHTGEKRARNVKAKAAHEAKEFFLMFLYLFVFLGLLRVHESVVLRQHDVSDLTRYGWALVNALILAKVMLVAEALHLGRRFEEYPLVYPILLKSLLFGIVLIGFHVIEDVIEGLWHGKTAIESIPNFGGGGLEGILSVGAIAFVGLIPFFALREISRVFGSASLQMLIFKRPANEFIIEFSPRERTGDELRATK
jgi:hypothetical protein